ncbi:phage tail tape measure protein [Microbacterium azadirachtae]|uniref:phage tail tape measure protein n=1 Tax=Microbacterium azadirachtae TaxID=582680 RepID=UPI0008819D1B|nr:phage tail tape measure protein [Microbacterium azadirachtae]SDL30435.1 Phage-related minor tail protein [Microbacterium azadirachtae]SEF60558.1 Phage-related minor tail protein [Microbacterium azadirachtae]SEF61171.1 Phage-related minor tail protein [Microbacterium azadirachtae]
MSLRVAELEALFTANTDQIEKADRLLAKTAQRAEKPIKLAADDRGVLGSMDRVEKEVKKLVSADTIVKLDADISRAQSQLDKAVVKLEDLQVRAEGGLDVTADTKRAEAQIQKLERSLAGLKKSRAAFDIDADAQQALAELRKVDTAQKRIVSADVVAKVDADISYAQKNVTRIQAQLEVLRSANPSPKVLVDISRAESQLDNAQRKLDGLSAARATMKVDADTSAAESSLKQVDGVAGKAGADSGRSFTSSLDAATRGAGEKVGDAVGSGIEDTLIQALAAIPVAGGIVLAGVAIGKAITGAIQDGLNVEKSMDRLAALTGLGEGDAQRIARGAGEAYANTFGSSIESNMDIARLALQFQIIDPKATTRDAQEVVQGLSGIADVLDEDVRPVATSVTQLLRTGLAKSSKDAFDILAAGARNGVNASEDMLDTFTEYPVVLSRLGLNGAESLGLISQALKAGARNSDVAADALKELQAQTMDTAGTARHGFETMGMNADKMYAKFAAGGPVARDALGQVLTGLRAIEDPTIRNQVALDLFKTKAEDLGASLYAMDLSTAVDQLDGVTGAAQRMFDTLNDNDATKMERAQRNIETAVTGIEAALASALSEPLGDFADWIAANRGPMLKFFQDMAVGALDFAATASDATGDFVSGPLAEMVAGIVSFLKLTNFDPFKDWTSVDKLIDDMRGFDKVTDEASATIRGWKKELVETTDPMVATGLLSDASIRLASSIDKVGVAAGGAKMSMAGLDATNLTSTETGRALADQIRSASQALDEQIAAGAAAKESQADLSARYAEGRQALADQLTAMGMTTEQAWALIDAYGAIPATKATDIQSNAPSRTVEINGLAYQVTHLPNGQITVTADTSPANSAIWDTVHGNYVAWIEVRATQPDLDGWVSGSGRPGLATGGPVIGPGTGTSDTAGLFRLSNGEHVITAREVTAMGGHDAVARVRRAALDGTLPGLASGGPVEFVPFPRSTAPVTAGQGFDTTQIVDLLRQVIAAIGHGPDGGSATVVLQQRIAAGVEASRRDTKSDAWSAAQVLNAAQGL